MPNANNPMEMLDKNLVDFAAVPIGFNVHMIMNNFDVDAGGIEGLATVIIGNGINALYFHNYYEIKLK